MQWQKVQTKNYHKVEQQPSILIALVTVTVFLWILSKIAVFLFPCMFSFLYPKPLKNNTATPRIFADTY